MGFQLIICGSFDEKLTLKMFLRSASILSSISWRSLPSWGLVMVKISSLLSRCLSVSSQAQTSFWSASNLDLRCFATSARSPVSYFSSISFFSTVHSHVSCVLLLWYSQYFSFFFVWLQQCFFNNMHLGRTTPGVILVKRMEFARWVPRVSTMFPSGWG